MIKHTSAPSRPCSSQYVETKTITSAKQENQTEQQMQVFYLFYQVELLLNNGAPINAGLEREGGSVLHHAVKAGNVEVVETLLENKVEIFY